MTEIRSFLKDDGYVIFLFHGVIRQQHHRIRNYTGKHVALERFIKIIGKLCTNGHPVSMTDIVKAHRGELELPPRAFAVTFDDGFENNYVLAAPVLTDFNVPATIYVTTEFVESNSFSWIDQIENAFERRDKFELRLISDIRQCANYAQKIDLLNEIRQLVKNDPKIDPYAFADHICMQLQIKNLEPDPELDQKMNWRQVRELSETNFFTIGGHSHTHRILSHLSLPDLRYEVNRSLSLLRENLSKSIHHYSYPEGMSNCYSPQVIEVLKENDIICCPSAEMGANTVDNNLFHLKRIMVV
jgi:peptidoglycan/xylan/chitin deacetylase (PgdA/CDA1 family)